MKMMVNMSHIILGTSEVNILASLPSDLLNSTEIQFLFHTCKQRQLQASHTSTFPRTSGKAPPSQSTSSSWDCPCETADTKHGLGLQHCRQTSHTAPAPRMLFLTFTPCVLQNKRDGKRKTVQSIAASAYLLSTTSLCYLQATGLKLLFLCFASTR